MAKMTVQAWVEEMLNKRLLIVIIAPTLWFLGAIAFKSKEVYTTVVVCSTIVIAVYFLQSAAKCIVSMMYPPKPEK